MLRCSALPMAVRCMGAVHVFGRVNARYIGSYAFAGGRTPLLEELFEPLVLKKDEMNQDASSTLRGYTPPALMSQAEASLSAEFGRHLVKTDWSEYRDPLEAAQYEQAARLLELTLATIRRSAPKYQQSPPSNIGERNDRWLKEQCDLLLEEIKTGDASRWVKPEQWIGENRWRALTDQQRSLLMPAVTLLGRNPNFHPDVKRRILEEVIDTVCKTVE